MSEKTSVLRTAVWERSRNGESVSEIARALNTDERIVTLIVNTFERLESKRRSGERPLPDMKDALRAVKAEMIRSSFARKSSGSSEAT